MSRETYDLNGVRATAARTRSAALDAVRVLGIAVVVLGHTWPDAPGLRLMISPWHVPAFFLLSGYLWSSGRGLRSDLRRRARSLLVPYACWLAALALPFLVWRAVQGHDALRTAFGIAYGAELGRPFSAFWFVVALFWAGLLVRLCQLWGRGASWLLGVAGLVAVQVAGPQLADTPLSIGLAAACAAFVLIGQELRRVRPRIRRPGAVGVILLGLVAVALGTGIYTPLDLKYGDFGPPVIGVLVATAASTGLILVAEATVPRLSESVQRRITVLASAGLAVLLGHAAVLYLGDSLLGLPLPLVFVAALVLPWAIGLLSLRTRFAPLVVGVPAPAARTTSGVGPGGPSAPAGPAPGVPAGPVGGSSLSSREPLARHSA